MSYSRIISLTLGKENSINLMVFPNPVSGNRVQVKLSIPSAISLMNDVGAEVWRSTLPPGTSNLTLPLLPAGIYRLRAGKETVPLIVL